MFLILFVVACLTQLPQDTEAPCAETVFYQGSTAFCQGANLDITLHLDPNLKINDVMFNDGQDWYTLPFSYYDTLYNTNVYHTSYHYLFTLDYTCSDLEVVNLLVYTSSDSPYSFLLNVNKPNNQE